jgi:hypothetical protein
MNPLGQELPKRDRGGGGLDTARFVVVGVYDDSYGTTRGEDRVFTAYRAQWRKDALLVRTRGSSTAFVPELRALLVSAAPTLPVSDIETQLQRSVIERRDALIATSASLGAGALALFLASIGVFAVVSIAVGQRKREIGLRIALGGQPLRVAAAFFASGLRLSATGLLVGLPVSALVVRVAINQGIILVPEVSVTLIALAISAVVLMVASAASWLPARHAAKVDPSTALRAD